MTKMNRFFGFAFGYRFSRYFAASKTDRLSME